MPSFKTYKYNANISKKFIFYFLFLKDFIISRESVYERSTWSKSNFMKDQFDITIWSIYILFIYNN